MRLFGALPGRNPGSRTRPFRFSVTCSSACSTLSRGISNSRERLQSVAVDTSVIPYILVCHFAEWRNGEERTDKYSEGRGIRKPCPLKQEEKTYAVAVAN